MTAAAVPDPARRDWGGALAGPAGDVLVTRGLVTAALREAAIDTARLHRADPTDALLGCLPIGARPTRAAIADLYARDLGLMRADLAVRPLDPELFEAPRAGFYADHLLLPWYREGGCPVYACASPDAGLLALAEELAGGPVRLAVATRAEIMGALIAAASPWLTEQARELLRSKTPEASAGTPAPRWQWRTAAGAAAVAGAAVLIWPDLALPASSALVSLFYLGNLVLRAALVLAGRRPGGAAPPPLPDHALPSYSVLVPMYREPEVLPQLAAGLDRLDYPPALLDIKLVLEADDRETLDEALRLGLAERFDIVLVPPSEPRTKPKACNFALPLARGERLVIFDAEDRPESDQLRRAAAAFAAGPPDLACVQARLNFDNAEENWLTRMFAIDYALWFDFLLPGLDRLGMPLPLGGTSNHFRTAVLREVLAWDPFNVTEDADLGLRLQRRGYRVGVIASTTFEEANCEIGNWIRQRSRWLKGYMLTFTVQMRSPADLWRRLGPLGFFGFAFFIGGTALSALINPLVWGCFALWVVAGSPLLDPLFPAPVLVVGLFNWLGGNFLYLYLAMLAPLSRRWFGLVPWALTVTPYWALVSIAGYRALWQWIRRPFHWDKTRHGLSRQLRTSSAGTVT
ncbi:glycosyltransferase family 2 protein [Zavarzinia sp.]|uniref:glycosyltransferase family 2 protein n=1 Tax=Zavarzinia sp. TaxID=2027920 RepID=UPI003564836D